MTQYSLEFCFKGSRQYVHGTDIYNKLIETVKEKIGSEKVDLSFHDIVKTNVNLNTQKPTDEKLLKFVFKFINREGSREVLYAVENNKTIECRYAYPEEEICQLSNIDIENQKIFLDQDSSYTFVENTVALNKYLLENLFPNAEGKWYFTRFQLTMIPNEIIYPLRLELRANFNFKLTKTEIFINQQSVGFIYFSLV